MSSQYFYTFGFERYLYLQKCSVADLQNLALYVFAHVRREVQTGICLIHRIAFRAREVYEMFAVLKHLGTTRLLPCLICKMSRRHCCTRCYSIDPYICIYKTHCNILGKCVDCTL